MVRSMLNLRLVTVRCRLEEKVKRCIGEFTLVTILPAFLACFLKNFNTGDWANTQGDGKAFAC